MSTICLRDIENWLHHWAPPETAASWDNVGMQIGDRRQRVSRVLLSLDVDQLCLDTMDQFKPHLVITHHPIFFKPLKSINYDSDMGRILTQFFKHKTALLTAHTNLDCAIGGVNDTFASYFGFQVENGKTLHGSFGKVFSETRSIDSLLSVMPAELKGATEKENVHKIAVCCGSGHGMVSWLPELGIDCLITGEITYHDHVFCNMHAISVITVGHKESEDLIVPIMGKQLAQSFGGLTIEEI